MEKNSIKVSFQEYNDSSFPVGGKRTRSAVIRKEVAQRIANHLNGTPDADGASRSSLRQKERLCVGGLAIGWNKRRHGCFCERKESGTNPFTMVSSTFFLAPPPPPPPPPFGYYTYVIVSKLYSSYIEWQ